MHAVVVKVTINDPEPAERNLREQVVPGVSQAPGFVAGYWTREDNDGLAMILFDIPDIRLFAQNDLRFLRQFA